MSNDRIWLTCKVCGAQVLLAKWWASYAEGWDADYALFIETHLLKCLQEDLLTLPKGADLPFVLTTEAD